MIRAYENTVEGVIDFILIMKPSVIVRATEDAPISRSKVLMEITRLYEGIHGRIFDGPVFSARNVYGALDTLCETDECTQRDAYLARIEGLGGNSQYHWIGPEVPRPNTKRIFRMPGI